MFKILVISCLVLVAQCQAPPKPKQAKKTEELSLSLKEALKRLEGIDVEMIMANERILTSHLKCALNKGPCTSDGKLGKQLIRLLIDSRCSECSLKQRKIIKKIILQLKNRRPKEWTEIVKIYDPQGNQYMELEKFLRETAD